MGLGVPRTAGPQVKHSIRAEKIHQLWRMADAKFRMSGPVCTPALLEASEWLLLHSGEGSRSSVMIMSIMVHGSCMPRFAPAFYWSACVPNKCMLAPERASA